MTGDTARMRRLIACMRELADRLAVEVESIERHDDTLVATLHAENARDAAGLMAGMSPSGRRACMRLVR